MAKGSVPASVAAQYEARYAAARIRPERVAQIDRDIDRIVAERASYEEVAGETGVPWYVVAVIHLLESDLSFSRHLHNGDPLTGRTVHVPADRPAAPPRSGSFPYTWEESASDALSRFRSWRNWGVAGTLYQLERYNGWGYQNRGVPSPYLWSYSDQYERGKYASDGVYDPDLVSRQPGAASVLKRMEERRIISIPR
jgi:lysozyme family protein